MKPCIDCGEPVGHGIEGHYCAACERSREWEYASGRTRSDVLTMANLLHDLLDSEIGQPEFEYVAGIKRVRKYEYGVLVDTTDGRRLEITISEFQA